MEEEEERLKTKVSRGKATSNKQSISIDNFLRLRSRAGQFSGKGCGRSAKVAGGVSSERVSGLRAIL